MTDFAHRGDQNRIHASSVIVGQVSFGSGNEVGPHVAIYGPCSLGDDNWIGSSCAIGSRPQGRQYALDSGIGVRIGSRTVLHEFLSLQQGTVVATTIGDDCCVMSRCSIGHDVELADGATLTADVSLGGSTSVGRGAVLGLGVVVHQETTIGAWAMIGMQSAVTRDVPPGALVQGVPAVIVGANVVGLRRAGYEEDTVERMDAFYRAGKEGVPGGIPDRLVIAFDEFRSGAQRRSKAR